MMLLRNISLFAALAAVSLVNISDAVAVPNFENNNRVVAQKQGDRRQRWIEKLNLSQEQKNQIAEIREKYRDRMSPLREKYKSARQELRTMLNGTARDSQIRAKHREVVRLRQQLENLRFDSTLEMRNVMTVEQRQEFAKLMEERRQRHRRRMENRRRSEF